MARLALGLALVLLCWPLDWALAGLRTHVLFFPLWLGTVLALDGACERRTGSSAWRRSPRAFAALFVVSAGAWWLFELANLRLQNWEYLGRERFGDLAYGLLASLSFSTVLPAVLGMAELLRSTPPFARAARGPRWPAAARAPVLRASAAAGALGLAAMLVWPRALFPLVWVGGVLVLEPLARRLGRPSLTPPLARGDWRRVAALAAGGLACGFLWELWNARSYPKWIYHVPVGGPRLFEMPLVGYLGYVPFAFEVFLLASLASPRFVRGLAEPEDAQPANEPG